MSIKSYIFGILLLSLACMPMLGGSYTNSFAYPQAAAAEDDGMGKVQLMIKKLRSSMASMKDFDELEKAGMAKKDVDRMRRAMNQKISQMMDETVELINAL